MYGIGRSIIVSLPYVVKVSALTSVKLQMTLAILPESFKKMKLFCEESHSILELPMCTVLDAISCLLLCVLYLLAVKKAVKNLK
jgi:hypothetical protein